MIVLLRHKKTITINTTNMSTIHLTKADFISKVMDYEKNPDGWNYIGDKPAIIDFYATWCGPCNHVAPILEEISDEYEGKIYVYKIDTDKEQELSAAFGIETIPTLIFVPLNGEPKMSQGAMPKSAFKEIIEDVLLK